MRQMRHWRVAVFLSAATVLAAPSAWAGSSAYGHALGQGGEALSADQIEEQFVGRTGTWVSASGGKKIRIYYGDDNNLEGRQVGGDWSDTGYYGVADDGSICISWDGIDAGRLRCLKVVIDEGTVFKFNADGSRNGRYISFDDGRSF